MTFATIGLDVVKAEKEALLSKSHRVEQSLRAVSFSKTHLNSVSAVPPLVSSKILPAMTADMQALAQQSGLTVSGVNYKSVDGIVTSNFSRVDISAQFRGTYVPLKKFIATMLSTYDSLALESVIMRRDRPTDLMLDIELHWTLFYRKQP